MAIKFGTLGGANDVLIGKYDKPLKALILEESNIWEKRKTLLDYLYNVEKSNRFAEAVGTMGSLGRMKAVKEGARLENMSAAVGFSKYIEHIAYGGTFTVTKKMMDDSVVGLTADMKLLPRAFIGSYYKTKNFIAAKALSSATANSVNILGETVDLTTGDGLSLFNKNHRYSADGNGTQSNYFKNGTSTTMTSTSTLELTLERLASKLRNFKDENGDTMGYIADTIIIPSNRPELKMTMKKVLGTELATGGNFNDINIQFGNWNLIELDGWEESNDKFMVMSSEANKNLMGNMFYNRLDFEVESQRDFFTKDYIWSGYTRVGAGFSTWKHIALFDDAETNAAATQITA